MLSQKASPSSYSHLNNTPRLVARLRPEEAHQWRNTTKPCSGASANSTAIIDVDRARRVWQSALEAGDWTGDPVWVHGDLLPGNILIEQRPTQRHH